MILASTDFVGATPRDGEGMGSGSSPLRMLQRGNDAITDIKNAKVTTKYIKGERYYLHDDADQVPGVSSIKGTLPAPALANWFKSFTAEYAIDNIDMVRTVAAEDKAAALELVKNATQRHSRKAADQGTRIHGLCEELMRDKMAGVKSSFAATPEDMLFLKNFARFVAEFEVEPVAVERTVWNREIGYAGTCDLIARLKDHEGLWIVDYKTGNSGIWHDTGIQQVGYVRATEYIDDDGNFQPMPKIEGAYALWLRDTGWALHPLRTDEYMFETFKYLRAVYEYTRKGADTVVGKPINKVPLKRVWKGKK